MNFGQFAPIAALIVVVCILSATTLWIFYTRSWSKDLAGPAATVLAGLCAVTVAAILGSAQVRVANIQADIAARSWQTSNEKLVLDLFDRRVAVFQEVRSLVSAGTTSITTADNVVPRYAKAIELVPFLFDHDVQEHLIRIGFNLKELERANAMLKTEALPERQKWQKLKDDASIALAQFEAEAQVIFLPYLKMHPKNQHP